jgi:predicted lipoprotein with Yx(FWY)xxD motif
MRSIIKARRIVFTLTMIGALALAACSQAGQYAPGASGANPTPTQMAPMAYGTPQGAIPATGNQPSVTVSDQATDGSSVVVAKVVSKGPGWIAIHAQQGGQVGQVIGYTHVNDGENDNVTVKIDPTKATPTMYAMLHIDAGQVGVYEFPGPDVPYMANGQMITPAFNVTKAASASLTPSVTLKDQDVSSGKVLVDDVVSNGPGWVDIHVDNPDGTMGKEIGYTAVHSGDNRNVVVTIDASKATPTMHAMLHVDAGTPGVFENPGADVTVMLNGQMVGASFKDTAGQAANAAPNTAATAPAMPGMNATPAATSPAAYPTQPSAAYPTQAPTQGSGSGGGIGMVMATPSGGMTPSVKVSDQQIQNGTVKVDDVVSSGPGWIVIYTVKNGQPDQPIGYTHVNDGDNPNVVVKIDTSKPVDTLYAQLHVDAGTVGTFEFPGPDVPVMMGVQMISGTFRTNTNAQAAAPTQTSAPTQSMTMNDQAIHNSSVVVAHVLATGESWVVIHPQNPDGSIGDMIGATAVHPGETDNVVVHIDTSRATPTMWGMLHVNVSKAPYPQYPGVDVPVMIGGKMVLPQFKVTGPLAGDVPLQVSKNNAGVAYLTDGQGMSLYLSLNDQPGVSNCTGDCLKQWRPLLATGSIKAGDGVSVNKIGVIFLPDHTRQVTYNSSPLYYFTGDQKAGDTNGQGSGGSWFLVTP